MKMSIEFLTLDNNTVSYLIFIHGGVIRHVEEHDFMDHVLSYHRVVPVAWLSRTAAARIGLLDLCGGEMRDSHKTTESLCWA